MTETKRDFTEDQRICDEATDGPWEWYDRDYYVAVGRNGAEKVVDTVVDESGVIHRGDSAFIAEARTGWPAALAEIARLQAELDSERSMREAFAYDFEISQSQLEGVTERSVRRKEALYKVRNVTMSMFATKDDMIHYMKQAAKEALDGGE